MKFEIDKQYSIIVNNDATLSRKVIQYLIDNHRVKDTDYSYLYNGYSIEVWSGMSTTSFMTHERDYWNWMDGERDNWIIVYGKDVVSYVPDELFMM